MDNQTPNQTPSINQGPASISPPQPVNPSPLPNQPSSVIPFLSKNRLFFRAFVLGLVAVGSITFAILNSNSSKTQPSPTPAPTSIPTPTPTDETANWKTYENKTFGFSFKYPDDLKVSENKGVIIFDNEDKLPKNEYKLIPADKYIGITVTVGKTSRDFPLEEYLRQTYPENNYGLPVFEKRKNDFREVEIDNIKGLVSSRGLSFEDVTKTAWMKKGAYVYKISAIGYGTGSTYTKTAEQVFDQILSTFKFTDVSPIGGDQNITPKACTQEAKLCPDGSSVGRQGPNCEFSACPETP